MEGFCPPYFTFWGAEPPSPHSSAASDYGTIIKVVNQLERKSL